MLVYAEEDTVVVGDREHADKFIPSSLYVTSAAGHGWDDVRELPDMMSASEGSLKSGNIQIA